MVLPILRFPLQIDCLKEYQDSGILLGVNMIQATTRFSNAILFRTKLTRAETNYLERRRQFWRDRHKSFIPPRHHHNVQSNLYFTSV